MVIKLNSNQNNKINSNVIWIDADIANEQNNKRIAELKQVKQIKLFKDTDSGINFIKHIKFEETKVIIDENLYSKFINEFKENIIYIYVAPKFIIFSNNKEKFIGTNRDYQNKENSFYNFGGVVTSIEEIIHFLINDNNTLKNDKETFKKIEMPIFSTKEWKMCKSSYSDDQVTFGYIDNKEQLILPLFFKKLIDNIPIYNMRSYTKMIYNIYSKDYREIKELLGPIELIPNIPIERYYQNII